MRISETIYADFQNVDKLGRVRLNLRRTLFDLKTQRIMLEPGKELVLDNDAGVSGKGIVQFSEEEDIWVAVIPDNEQ
ncbi:hypothetical protein [Chitinophaga tropicalis]|uniref:Uncharacterized protein n=1 Tax=Chitinophaga tropicalis TaxID=2683588 RepID=A0A7K1U2S0_9BACT|nr:hypothetical protein [Chitinophaga tropicalis]MVT08305.1 hypothetical protein [Chitinophaga tropicalis]